MQKLKKRPCVVCVPVQCATKGRPRASSSALPASAGRRYLHRLPGEQTHARRGVQIHCNLTSGIRLPLPHTAPLTMHLKRHPSELLFSGCKGGLDPLHCCNIDTDAARNLDHKCCPSAIDLCTGNLIPQSFHYSGPARRCSRQLPQTVGQAGDVPAACRLPSRRLVAAAGVPSHSAGGVCASSERRICAPGGRPPRSVCRVHSSLRSPGRLRSSGFGGLCSGGACWIRRSSSTVRRLCAAAGRRSRAAAAAAAATGGAAAVCPAAVGGAAASAAPAAASAGAAAAAAAAAVSAAAAVPASGSRRRDGASSAAAGVTAAIAAAAARTGGARGSRLPKAAL